MTRDRMRISVALAVTALAVGASVILAACGGTASTGSSSAVSPAVTSAPPGSGSPAASQPAADWAYYQSVMRGYGGGGMMGGGSSSGWMMSRAGYQWMTGASGTPGWMTGGRLPGYMMGGGTDPGQVMGRLWAGAPGPRVSPAQAAQLGIQVPAGAALDRAANRITFTGNDIRFTVVASPPGGPDETFRIAGLVNPAIMVPAGARVTITLVNADPDTAHGIVITAAGAAGSPMPMMTARLAFTGSALWFLGDATSAGMPAGTITFTAAAAGTYQYLCPVPRHAQEGMTGTFTITG